MGKGVRRQNAASRLGRPLLPPMGSLGQDIRKARVALGLTQAEVGGDRYTATYVSALERGRLTNPSPEAIAFLESRLKLERGSLTPIRSARVADAIAAAIELVTRSQPTTDLEARIRRSALAALQRAAATDDTS